MTRHTLLAARRASGGVIRQAGSEMRKQHRTPSCRTPTRPPCRTAQQAMGLRFANNIASRRRMR